MSVGERPTLHASLARGGALLAQVPPMLRWMHCTQAALYTVVGAYLAGGTAGAWSLAAWRAALVVWLVVAFGFVANDYFDIDIDRVSKPDRPIPAGKTSVVVARALAAVLAGAALLVALTLGLGLAAFALANLAGCVLYSAWLKRSVLLGNATMALLDATIVLFGGLAVGQLSTRVWLVAALVFVFFLGYELVKTVEDCAGDARAGILTTATQWGIPATVRLFQCVAVLFFVVAWLPWLVLHASLAYLAAIMVCCGLPALGVAWWLGGRQSPADVALALRALRYIWLVSWLPMVLLR